MKPKLSSRNQSGFHLAIYAGVTLATTALVAWLLLHALERWPIGDFPLPIWRVC
jgi:hypothetical protein